MGLVTLEQLASQMPDVAAKLANGFWTKEAEEQLFTHLKEFRG